MGTLTLSVFRTELWYLLEQNSELDPSVAANQTRLDRWINMAYARVARPSTFRHMEIETTANLTLVTATPSYTLAATIWATDHIHYVEGNYSLRRIIRRELSNRTIGSGAPTEYARWGRTIYLDRSPTSTENGHTLRVFGWLIPTQLSTDVATVLTFHWDEAILKCAAWLAWQALGDSAKADYFREDYAASVNDVREVLGDEARDTGGDFTLDYLTQDTMRRM